MSAKESDLIGQLLIQKGLITVDALERALLAQEKTEALLGETLIKMGFISEEKFYKVLSEQLGAEYVKLKEVKIPPAVINEIPAKFAIHYKLIPLKSENNAITIAMVNPLDIHTLDDIKLLLRKEIKTVLSSEKDITEAIKKYYGVGAETIEGMAPGTSQEKVLSVQSQETQDLVESAEDASIIKFVNQILLEAYKDRATDIHIEPYEDELKVRYRVDGILYETKVPPTIKNFQSAIMPKFTGRTPKRSVGRKLVSPSSAQILLKWMSMKASSSTAAQPSG